MQPARPLRLLHFDLKTRFSYGDQLLFELVRQVFNSYGDGECFEVTASVPLRDEVTPQLDDSINRDFDGVVVGGGGLFLRSSNPNDNSGWQWNAPLEVLERLERPLIVFAVGNSRFFGQEDFDPIFYRHIERTVQAATFFGVRERGTASTVAAGVPPEIAGKIRIQPCPTTLLRHLLPDRAQPIPTERRLGVQIGLGQAHLELRICGWDDPGVGVPGARQGPCKSQRCSTSLSLEEPLLGDRS